MQNLGFSDSIINWYRAHKRELPWRQTTNPYHIWISEIILQQTRVDQGLAYYYNILQAFPTVQEMALAQEDQLLKLWQGLGYYSRARNMHATSQVIHNQYNGVFPSSYEGLLQLKGIGPYTAAAIASFCYKEPVAVVDGNVERVLSRFYGLNEPIDSPMAKRAIRKWATENLSVKSPDIHNQAIMEFGALQCTPKSPNCHNCVLIEQCQGLRANLIDKIPFKAKRTKVKQVFIDYFVSTTSKEVAFRKREQSGIWENLFDFPAHECESEQEQERLTILEKFYALNDVVHATAPLTHLLSHRKLIIRFHVARVKKKPNTPKLIWQEINKIQALAVPRPVQGFLEEANGAKWWRAGDK